MRTAGLDEKLERNHWKVVLKHLKKISFLKRIFSQYLGL